MSAWTDALGPTGSPPSPAGAKIDKTLEGIAAARAAGLAVKVNAVALKGVNEDEFDAMLAWCGERGLDLCLIETMPMGDVADRTAQYLPLSMVRARLRRRWTLTPDRLPDRRPGALFRRGRDGLPDRLYHGR